MLVVVTNFLLFLLAKLLHTGIDTYIDLLLSF